MMLSRRSLLLGLGWTAIGTTVIASAGCSALRLLPALPSRNESTRPDAASWLQLLPDGRFRLFDPRAEMGQDAGTGLLQIAADELGVAPARIELVTPSTDDIAMVRSTVGSESIQLFGPLVAGAAATLRDRLGARAALRLGVAIETLEATDAGFLSANGALVAWEDLIGAPGELLEAADPAPGPAVRVQRAQVGAPLAAVRLEDIVRGAPLFACDVRLPDRSTDSSTDRSTARIDDMVHGRVLTGPRPGAAPLRIDDTAARAMDGCLGVIRDGDLAVLIATRSGVLDRAEAAVAVEWSQLAPLDVAGMAQDLDVDDRLARGALEHRPLGDAMDPEGPWTVDLRLSVPFAAHAFLEPRSAVARWRDGRLDLWTGTQDPWYVRAHLAKTLAVEPERITVHPQRLGGSFGGRTLCTVELQAARAARVLDRSVRIQWTRAAEFRDGFHRPPSEHRLRGRLGADGRISHWWHAFTSGHVIFTSAAMPGWMQTATGLVPDPGVARGAAAPYAFGRTRVEFSDVRLPIATGPWRGLGAGPNGCAVELLMDALALAADADPVQFRLDHLPADATRLRQCLLRVAALARSGDARPTGTELGIACGVYKDTSFVAAAAELARTENDGWRCLRLWCVQDSGRIINPDRVRAQIEGNLVWALGMVGSEVLAFGPDGPLATQFGPYRLPLLGEIPPMEIELIESHAPSGGAAESAMAAAPAAILIALARLRGVHGGALPFAAREAP